MKKKLEEQRENYRKRQDHHHQQQQPLYQRIPSPMNAMKNAVVSPPLAFTPTSVLRKMTADKEPEGGHPKPSSHERHVAFNLTPIASPKPIDTAFNEPIEVCRDAEDCDSDLNLSFLYEPGCSEINVSFADTPEIDHPLESSGDVIFDSESNETEEVQKVEVQIACDDYKNDVEIPVKVQVVEVQLKPSVVRTECSVQLDENGAVVEEN